VTQRKIPARLDVLLAPKARKAIVLRRGPAKFVCSIGWDLSNDTFEIGQWTKGRIHSFCCDLSPDGRLLLYYLMKPEAYPYHWTVVSQAPYLKPIGRWNVHAGIFGGGIFLSDEKCWLNNSWGVDEACNEITEEHTQPEDAFQFDWRCVYFSRLVRDGWTVEKRINQGTRLDTLTFAKPVDGQRVLKNTRDGSGVAGLGRGLFSGDYQIVDFGTGEVQFCRDWEWADVDGQRLLWAEGGKIFAANIEAGGLGPEMMLYDFNDMTFQEIEAPY
jgi:hypothetical protein